MNTDTLAAVIDTLVSRYGRPAEPPVTSALEMILWENVAYLADDERRIRAFEMLRETVGITPEAILAAGDDELHAVARHGIVPDQTVAKLRNIAAIMLTDFPDGLEPVLLLPHKQAVKALRKFPAIGEPAADKIMLFTRTLPVFSLESNGLRVLQRIGYGSDTGNYAADYRAVMRDIAGELPSDCDWLALAYQTLRRHGQVVCRRGEPSCGGCPVRKMCEFGAARTELVESKA